MLLGYGFFFAKQNAYLQLWSISRVGRFDLGVNKKCGEEVHAQFKVAIKLDRRPSWDGFHFLYAIPDLTQ